MDVALRTQDGVQTEQNCLQMFSTELLSLQPSSCGINVARKSTGAATTIVDKAVAIACALNPYSRLKRFFAPLLENWHKWHLLQSGPSLQPFLLRTYLHGNWQHIGWPCEPIDGHHDLPWACSGDGDLVRKPAVLGLSCREKEKSPLGMSARRHCLMASA